MLSALSPGEAKYGLFPKEFNKKLIIASSVENYNYISGKILRKWRQLGYFMFTIQIRSHSRQFRRYITAQQIGENATAGQFLSGGGFGF
jgi:hypothetical protein